MIRRMLFSILFCAVGNTFAINSFTYYWNLQNGDSVTFTRWKANNDSVKAFCDRAAVHMNTMSPLWTSTSLTRDSVMKFLRLDTIRSNPNIDSLTGDIRVTGSPSISGSLTLGARLTVDSIRSNPDVDSLGGDIKFSGSPTIVGLLTASNGVTVTKGIRVDTIRGSPRVDSISGNTRFTGSPSTSGSLTIGARLIADTIRGNPHVDSIAGNVILSGSPTITGTLNTNAVTGDVTITGSPSVTGSLTLGARLVVDSIRSNPNIDSLTGDVKITGSPAISGALTVGTNVTASGALIADTAKAKTAGKLRVIDTVLASKAILSGTLTPSAPARFYALEAITDHAHYGFLDESQITFSGVGTQGHASFNSNVKFLGTQNADHHASFQAVPHWECSGTASVVRGYHSIPFQTDGAITEMAHFQADDIQQTGGTAGSQYGLLLGNLTKATNNWAIYSIGSAVRSYFNGAIGIKTNDPQYPLHVRGEILFGRTSDDLRSVYWDGGTSLNLLYSSTVESKIAYTGGDSWIGANSGTAGSGASLFLKGSTGNIGIKNAAPDYPLHVRGEARFGRTTDDARSVSLNAGAGSIGLYSSAVLEAQVGYTGGDSWIGATSGTAGSGAQMFLQGSTGNLGVGRTPTSGYRFDVAAPLALGLFESTTGTNSCYLETKNTGGSLLFGQVRSTGNQIITGSLAYSGVVRATSGTLHLGGGNTIAMTALSTGATGFGSTTPAAKVSINGGCHVGGDSDPGDNNLLVDGTITGGATTVDSIKLNSGSWLTDFRSGYFIGEFKGFTTTVTDTVWYQKIGSVVTMTLPSVSGTSNADYLTFETDSIPSELKVKTGGALLTQVAIGAVTDNGTVSAGAIMVSRNGSGDWPLQRMSGSAYTTSFTASGDKGLVNPTPITYDTRSSD